MHVPRKAAWGREITAAFSPHDLPAKITKKRDALSRIPRVPMILEGAGGAGAPDDCDVWYRSPFHPARTALVLPTTFWTPRMRPCSPSGIVHSSRSHGKNRRHHMSLGTPTQRSISSDNLPSCIPANAAKEIQDPTARSLMLDMKVAHVQTDLCADAIETSYAQTGRGSRHDPVLLFIHSFDSNLLEFRRIWPLLREANAVSYAVDILGWGFTSKPKHLTYSVEEKREHLHAFLSQVVGDAPVTFVGASVGGAVAIDYALAYPNEVSQLVLIGAQAFVNKEASPMLERFKPLASFGAEVLKSPWLRRIAVRMSYISRDLKTEDTVRIGRLHTLTPGWHHASERFVRISALFINSPIASSHIAKRCVKFLTL
jgi:pimeloyl-ACP methyl ester carboxylesterase